MLVFCDESWKENRQGKKVGTLAAIAIPRTDYNALADRLFILAVKYFGFDNARRREIKGKRLISPYEFKREANGITSMKLSFVREVLEELRGRGDIRIFATVVYQETEVDLLCTDPERLERPYLYLMERVNEYVGGLGAGRIATVSFDDRGLGQNSKVAEAYRNFLVRSKMGRSFHALLRTPFFAYSSTSVGIQTADLVCTVINRYHTNPKASPRLPVFYSIVKDMEWVGVRPEGQARPLRGIKVLGDARKKEAPKKKATKKKKKTSKKETPKRKKRK